MTPRTRAFTAYAVVLAALVGVFALYTRPELLVTLSEQLWACF